MRFLLCHLGNVGAGVESRLGQFAVQSERESTVSVSGLGIVRQRPCVPRAIAANRRRAKFAWDIGCGKRATASILTGDQPYGEPPAGMFRIYIHAERTEGPAGGTGLVAAEKSEEQARTAAAFIDREGAQCAELVVERSNGDFFRIKRRLRWAHDHAAKFSIGFGSEMGLAVAEILLHLAQFARRHAVVDALPIGIGVEILRANFGMSGECETAGEKEDGD